MTSFGQLFRRSGWSRSIVILAAVCLSATTSLAQLSDPIPTPITKQGLRVQIEDFTFLPDSRNTLGSKPDRQPGADARINFLREAPDGRLFANDQRGQIYTIDRTSGQVQTFVDVDSANGGNSSLLPDIWFNNGNAAGLVSFNFHPDFESNGLFYTIHTERDQDVNVSPDFETVDLRGPSFGTRWHTVLTEWDTADPTATAWNESTGARRELLRVGTTASSYFHPYGDLQFNPTSQPGDADYGLMYVSGGDWGYINGAGAPQGSDATGQPEQLQRLDSLAGTLLRIDPRSPSESGGTGGLGDYTIPSANPFVDGDSNTLDEIYAYGFRNGHRMAWDTDGELFVSNIGSANIEEVERIVPGGNYGWAEREGTFISGTDSSGNNDDVFPINLPRDQDVDARGEPFLYPAVQYDHDEGAAIAGGFFYQGSQVPQLQGKFVFGDLVNGRVFAADADVMRSVDLTDPTTTAGVEEIQLFTRDAQGVETNVDLRADFFNGGRVDLRFGQTSDGELWLTTKSDGGIRRLVGDGVLEAFEAVVDRQTGEVVLTNNTSGSIEIDGYSLFSPGGGLLPGDGDWNSLEDQQVQGWEEASPTSSVLSELNRDGALVLAAGESVSLGAAYDGIEIAFGQSTEDLSFEYRTPSGQIADGVVNYEGDAIAKTLRLLVDPVSGEAVLLNDSSFAADVNGYSIISSSGSLSTEDWQSLSDQGVTGWDEAAPTEDALSELASGDPLSMTSEFGANLGPIAEAAAEGDLTLEFLLDGEAGPRAGVVEFLLRGDYNRDGRVDAADYTLWRDGSMAADGSGPIEGVPDGVVDQFDYDFWRDRYGAEWTSSVPVPEPTSVALIGLALLSLVSPRRCE